MSARLIKAISKNRIIVQNRNAGEVGITYLNHRGEVEHRSIQQAGELKLVPELTSAKDIRYSNVQTLAKRGLIRVTWLEHEVRHGKPL